MWKQMAVSAVMVTAVVTAVLLCISPGEVESVCAEMSSHVSSQVSRWLSIGSNNGGKAAEDIQSRISAVLPTRTVRRLDADPPPGGEDGGSPGGGGPADGQPKIESDRESIPGIDLKIAGLMEAGILSIAFMMLRTWRREQAAGKSHFVACLEKALTGSDKVRS
jgi:hypothetical protein